MMSDVERQLLDEAIAGDRVAMGRLLMRHDARLRRKIAGWIPARFNALVTVDDVLQETYAEAYRHIAAFRPEHDESLYAWLGKIAQRRYLNARRWLLAAKRGLDKQAARGAGDSASFVELIQLLGADHTTPSHTAARHEFHRHLQVALAGLKDDYREALRMRYIDGQPVRVIAREMGRTERAVHMLCNRGLRALRETMGSASRFLSNR